MDNANETIKLRRCNSTDSKKLSSFSSRILDSDLKSKESLVHIKTENKKRIIIVDDVAMFRDTYKKAFDTILSKYKVDNCECLTFNDGIYTLQQVIEDQENKLISLIVSDDQMKYIDGREAIEFLRFLSDSDKISSIPYSICVTADTDEDNINRLLQLGFNKVLNKNLPFKEIESILKDVGLILQ